MLAKAVARESEANFISIKGPELLSKWIGESEKGIREIFRKARSAAPCIIFFDEIDSIAMARDSNSSDAVQRVVSQLLTEMDGLEEMKGVTILAASNRPDIIDPALMRPGRFDKTIFIGNPDQKSREAILKVHVSSTKLADDINLEEIAEKTEGYSGAELSAIISYAKMELIRGYIKEHSNQIEKHLDELVLNQIHVMEALKEINPSSDKKYELKPVGISEINDIGIA
jgi:transitional endoplasmic reticulum ATPase